MLRSTKVFFTVILAALLALGAVAAHAEKAETLYEQSFDAPAQGSLLPEGWAFDSWTIIDSSAVSNAETVQLEGSSERGGVLHITASADDDAKVKTSVKVQPSTIYRLSCYIKTDNVVCDNAENSGEPSGANISLIGDIIARSPGVFGSCDWQYVELVGVTASYQTELIVSCRVGGYSSLARGEAWFDDFKIEKLDSYGGEYINFFAAETDNGSGEGSDLDPVVLTYSAAILLDIGLVTVIALIALIIAGFLKKRDDRSGNDEEEPLDESRLRGRKKAQWLAERDLLRENKLMVIRGRNFWSTGRKMPEPTDNKLHFVKLDWIFITVLTLVYAFVALFRLGTLNYPTSTWRAQAGQTVRITFAQSAKISKIWQNSGVSYCDYTITTDDGESFAMSSPREYGAMFKWAELNGSCQTPTSGVTLTVVSGDTGRPREPDLELNELAFFDENGELIPCSVDDPAAAALLDEQDTVPEAKSYMNSMYFDEVYHARTAYEHIHNYKVYEWTHPPLGKLIISLGILIFGMKPFGWRVMGAFFGILMVPLMYCFSKRIVKRPQLSLLSTTLLAFDFMHFTQTRIATVDTYALFFTLLMTYYMYQFLRTNIADGVGKMFKPLALSGLFFGIGVSCKWTCLYTGAALAVLFFGKLIHLLVQSIVVTRRDAEHRSALPRFWPRAATLCLWCVLFFVVVPVLIYSASYCRYYSAEWEHNTQQAVWSKDRSRGETADDVELTFNEKLDTYLNGVIKNQQDMYGYHSGLDSEHNASSPWWMWLQNLRPTWFHVARTAQYTVTYNNWDGSLICSQKVNNGEAARPPENLLREGYTFAGWDKPLDSIKANTVVTAQYAPGADPKAEQKAAEGLIIHPDSAKYAETISTFGNPAVWNLCFFGVILLVVVLIIRRRFTTKAAFLFVCMGAALLPWVFVTRSTYAYHYFSTVPYIILASVYALKHLEDRSEFRTELYEGYKPLSFRFVHSIKYAWVGVAVVLFMLYYPVISGLSVPEEYILALQWIPASKLIINKPNGDYGKTFRFGWTFLGYE